MNDELPTYRVALNDSDHPFHEATWIIFGELMNAGFAARKLEDQKDELIPYLFEIVDDESLRNEDSLGKGVAPGHAVELLGEWEVTEAAPRLLKIFEYEDTDSLISDSAHIALGQMGPVIVDDMLKMLERIDEERYFEIAEILSEVGQGDQRVFDWLAEQFTKQKEYYDVYWYAEYLLECDTAQAIHFLREEAEKRSKKERKIIHGIIKDWHDRQFDE